MGDSSSEEESLLDIIAGTSDIRPKLAPVSSRNSEEPQGKRPKLSQESSTRLTRSSLQFLAGLSSDDWEEVQIPAIFKTHAKENERLLAKDAKIQDELRHDVMKVKEEFQSLSKTKDSIIRELNDNGCKLEYETSNTHHHHLIESLVKKSRQRNDEFAFRRQFFFYSNVDTISALDLGATSSNLDRMIILIGLNTGNYSKFYHKYVEGRTKEFLLFVLLKVTNITQLQLVGNLFRSAIDNGFAGDDSITAKDFQGLISACGGDGLLLTTSDKVNLPVKFNLTNNFTSLLLHRLTIIFYCTILGSKAENELHFTVLRVFLLTLSDLNINNNLTTLHDTLLGVFHYLIQWRMRFLGYREESDQLSIHDTMVYEWNNVLRKTFNCRIYNSSAPISKYHDYELVYNVFRLIDSVPTKDQIMLRFVTSIKLSFITDLDYVSDQVVNKHATREEFSGEFSEIAPQFKLLHSVILKVGRIDVFSATREDSFDLINSIYKGYFNLLLLNSVIYSTFSNNQNSAANRAQYEAIKASNLSQLKKLEKITFAARDNIHIQLGQVILVPHKVTPYYDKEELVKVVTDVYFVLNYFHLWLTKDIRLLHQDMFYDNND